jgi:hypothetical protein
LKKSLVVGMACDATAVEHEKREQADDPSLATGEHRRHAREPSPRHPGVLGQQAIEGY